MDDTTRSIIRNVKGPGAFGMLHFFVYDEPTTGLDWKQGLTCGLLRIVREDDILCLLESEREARRLR